MHVVSSEIEECQRLTDYICDIVEKEKCNLIILGDLLNNFRAIDMEVLCFWEAFFNKIEAVLEDDREFFAIVGNHDMPGNGDAQYHALMSFKNKPKCVIVDDFAVRDNILFLPYFHNTNKFIETCNKLHKETDTNVLICHQTFLGIQYDNGFYSKDGAEPDDLPFKQIISGHIHTPSKFGKVWYPGAPRSRTLSDANVERNLVLLEIKEDGSMGQQTLYSTKPVCKQIMHFKDTPESPPQIEDGLNEYRIDIYGSEAYILERKAYYKSFRNVKLRSFASQSSSLMIKESDGIDRAFVNFFKNYEPKFGSIMSQLGELVKTRLKIDVER